MKSSICVNVVKKVIFYAVLTALMAISMASCRSSGVFRNGVFQGYDVRYRLGEPGDGWKSLKPTGADLAWIYRDGDATLLVNSRCVGVKDSSLEGLSIQLLIGLTEQKQLSAIREQRSGREALETTTSAKLDGVLRIWKSYVLKKDQCVYDIILSADPNTLAEAEKGYQAVKALFEVEPRPHE